MLRNLGFGLLRVRLFCFRSVLRARLWEGNEGAVSTEYVMILGAVALGAAAAIAGLGPSLFAGFERARGLLMCPLP